MLQSCFAIHLISDDLILRFIFVISQCSGHQVVKCPSLRLIHLVGVVWRPEYCEYCPHIVLIIHHAIVYCAPVPCVYVLCVT